MISARKLVNTARRLHFEATLGSAIPLHWVRINNWGDALNPVLVAHLSGQKVKYSPLSYCKANLVIGSVLGVANSYTDVWGSGFISSEATLNERPNDIHAVRGPLSRQSILHQGFNCPEVYGDPALLMPLLYRPQIHKRFKVGIIPHYVDQKNNWVSKIGQDKSVKLIDINSSIYEFIDDVLSCELIASSSLHGLICADSYGIPSVRLRISDKIIGGDFKFKDYGNSVGKDSSKVVDIYEDTEIGSIIDAAKSETLNCNLRSLLMACPFIDLELKEKVSNLSAADLSLQTLINAGLESTEILK